MLPVSPHNSGVQNLEEIYRKSNVSYPNDSTYLDVYLAQQIDVQRQIFNGMCLNEVLSLCLYHSSFKY